MLNQELERARYLAARAEQLDFRKEWLLTNMHLFCYEFIETEKAGEQSFRLEARNEFKILRKLAKLGHANVYRISKSLKDAGHYSTILRALRRMERKGLVRTVAENHKDRSQKTYEATLLGEAIRVLAEGNWKRAAEKIATQSPKFLDCQKIHQALGSEYYQYLTYQVIESLMYPETLRDPGADRDQAEVTVTECNGKWIRKNVMPKLNDPHTRSDGLRQIEQLASIPWMRSVVAQCLDEYVSETRDWLRAVDKLRQKSACAQDKTAR